MWFLCWYLEFALALLVAAALQLLEQQLVLGDALDGFDEVGADRVLDAELFLHHLEEGHAAELHQHRVRLLHVLAVVDVDVELLRLDKSSMPVKFPFFCVRFGRRSIEDIDRWWTYPSDEAVADVFGHDLVLLQLLEEDVLVELEDVGHVGEDGVLLADQARRRRFELAARRVLQRVPVVLDADLQVLDVRLFRLQQLGHNEPVEQTVTG